MPLMIILRLHTTFKHDGSCLKIEYLVWVWLYPKPFHGSFLVPYVLISFQNRIKNFLILSRVSCAFMIHSMWLVSLDVSSYYYQVSYTIFADSTWLEFLFVFFSSLLCPVVSSWLGMALASSQWQNKQWKHKWKWFLSHGLLYSWLMKQYDSCIGNATFNSCLIYRNHWSFARLPFHFQTNQSNLTKTTASNKQNEKC